MDDNALIFEMELIGFVPAVHGTEVFVSKARPHVVNFCLLFHVIISCLMITSYGMLLILVIRVIYFHER